MKRKIELVRREDIRAKLNHTEVTQLRDRLFAWEAIHNYTFMESGGYMRAVWCAWCMKPLLTLPSGAVMCGPIYEKLMKHACFQRVLDIPESQI